MVRKFSLLLISSKTDADLNGMRILLPLLMLVFTPFTFAKGGDDFFTKKNAPLVDVYFAHESGDFEFEDQMDKGKFETSGVGFRGGWLMPFLFIGGEVYFATTGMRTDNTFDQATREQYFLPDDSVMNYGGTMALNLGRLTLSGTYFFDSKVSGTVKNDDRWEPDAEYELDGSGFRFMAEIRLVKGLTIGVGHFSYSYRRYTVDRDINTLTKTDDGNRPSLDMNGTVYTIGYKIPFDLAGK